MKKSILFTELLGFFFSCSSQDGGDSITQPNLIPVAGDLGVHDPVMIKEDNTYYVFSTGGDIERPGGFIPFRISSDLRQWRDIGTVFEQMPQWATYLLRRMPSTSCSLGRGRASLSLGLGMRFLPGRLFGLPLRYLLFFPGGFGIMCCGLLAPPRPSPKWRELAQRLQPAVSSTPPPLEGVGGRLKTEYPRHRSFWRGG